MRLQLLIGIGERRLRGGELGLALVDRGLERLLLDREDHLVLFDLVAVLEQARTEKTLHASPQIDFFERLGAADKLGLLVIERSSAGWTSTAGGGAPCWAPAGGIAKAASRHAATKVAAL